MTLMNTRRSTRPQQLLFTVLVSLTCIASVQSEVDVLESMHPWKKPIQQGITIPAGTVTNSISCNEKQAAGLEKVLTVRSSQICQDFGLSRPSFLKCSAVNIIDQYTQTIGADCTPHRQVPPKSRAANGKVISATLPDRRPLPAGSWTGEQKVQLLAEEGATYYWHITNVINLFLWAPCHPIIPKLGVPHNATDWLVPEGWSVVKMISVITGDPRTHQGWNSTRLPMVANIRSADGAHLAVIVRGTRTALEWQVDLTYQQRRDPNYPGKVSSGFSAAANYLWPTLKRVLDQEVINGTVKHVTISGHSLGAALSTLLSYRMQIYLDEQLSVKGKQPVILSALLFACPNVGDDEFVAAFNTKVNARRLTFVPDVIPQVPCAPQMMACTDPHNPSYIPLVQSFNYQQVGGNIDFTPEEMPLQKDAWGKLDTINGCNNLVNATDSGRCKLWAEDSAVPAGYGNSNAAYCSGYPFTDPQYPIVPWPHRSKIVLGKR